MIRHAFHLLRDSIIHKRLTATQQEGKFLNQLEQWILNGFIAELEHQIFVCSFTENGNLLSQWRAYCPPGRGISLGFHFTAISETAKNQSFKLEKCIYEPGEQRKLVCEFLEKLISNAMRAGENTDSSKLHPTQSYYDTIRAYEGEFLLLGTILKKFRLLRGRRVAPDLVKNA